MKRLLLLVFAITFAYPGFAQHNDDRVEGSTSPAVRSGQDHTAMDHHGMTPVSRNETAVDKMDMDTPDHAMHGMSSARGVYPASRDA